MTKGIRVLERNGKNLVCRAKTPAAITGKALASLGWDDGVECLEISLEKDAGNAHEIIDGAVPRGYSVRLKYVSGKKTMKSPQAAMPRKDIKLRRIKDISELRALYIKTHMAYFMAPWSEYVDNNYLYEIARVIAKALGKMRAAVVEKSGRPVSMVMVYPLDTKNDLIAWVWIDGDLNPADRAVVQGSLIEWLKKSKAEKVSAFVNSFNARSNRFFRKIGFKIENVWVSKAAY